MKNAYLTLYTKLYTKKYTNTELLLNEIVKDEDHHFWAACRDVAEEQLKHTRWKWLSQRIDDFALLTTQYMISRFRIWLQKARLGIGALAKHIDSLERTLEWLFARWISTIKNLFDPRYKFSIKINHIVKYEEGLEV